MNVRCKNTGLGLDKNYLSVEDALALREKVDSKIDQKIQHWYETTPGAEHFFKKEVNKKYYIRHLIETVWRIRLLRVAEAKALSKIAMQSPRAAQIWANYEREEMLHDQLFLKDLETLGVTGEQVQQTEPYLETKLLSGYFSYLLDHEGPLGVVAYSYLVEYVNVKEEPKKLDALQKSVGSEKIQGQIAHAKTDEHEDHPGEVWEAIRYLIRDEEDIKALHHYLDESQAILALYFKTLYREAL